MVDVFHPKDTRSLSHLFPHMKQVSVIRPSQYEATRRQPLGSVFEYESSSDDDKVRKR